MTFVYILVRSPNIIKYHNGHQSTPYNYWNKEYCREELSKYIRKREAKEKLPVAYNSAYPPLVK